MGLSEEQRDTLRELCAQLGPRHLDLGQLPHMLAARYVEVE